MSETARRSDRASRGVRSALAASEAGMDRLASGAMALGRRAGNASRPRTSIAAYRAAVLLAQHRSTSERTLMAARYGLELSSFELAAKRFNGERFARAIPPLERTLELNRVNAAAGLETGVHLAEILQPLAHAYALSGRHNRACSYFSYERYVREQEGDKVAALNAVALLGECQRAAAKELGEVEGYRAAADSYEAAMTLAVDLGDLEAIAEAFDGRVHALVEAGDRSDEIVEFIEAAIGFWEGDGVGVEDQEHRLTRARNRLGQCLVERGEAARALAPLQKAVVSARTLASCSCRAHALRRLLEALEVLNDPVAAVPYLREAIGHYREIGNSNEVLYMCRLADSLALQGDQRAGLHEAEAAVVRAEEIFARDPGEEKIVAQAAALLGQLLNNRLGRYQQAISLCERGIEIDRRLGDEPLLANRLIQLAICRENVGTPDQLALAKIELKEALERCQRCGIQGDEAEAHYQLGLVFSQLEKPSEASSHLRLAEAAFRSLGEYRRVSSTLSALASIPGLASRQVVAALSEAARVSGRIQDPGAEAHALRELSRIRRAAGLVEEATESHRRGLELVESIRARLVGADERVSLLEAHFALYADAARLAHERHEPRRAFEYSEACRARSTLDRRVGDSGEGISDPELGQRRRELAAVIGERARQLERLGVQMLAEEAGAAGVATDSTAAGAAEVEAILERELVEVEGEWRGLEKVLAASDPRHGARAPAGLDSVWGVRKVQEELLDDGSVLLEYLTAEDGWLLFCIAKDRFETFELRLDPVELAIHVSQLCEALTRRDGGYPHGNALYCALVESAAEFIAGAREILICPSGPLHWLPFELLLSEDPGERQDGAPFFADRWSDLPYLLDDSVQIRYLSSATTEGMLRIAERAEPGDYGQEMLAMAAPLATVPTADVTSFHSLPFALEEVDAAAAAFDRDAVQVVPTLGEDGIADKETAVALLAGAANAYRFVHLATHALLNDHSPWLSALVLEPEAGAPEPGYLRANELIDLGLHSRCVTMSGCQTLGDVVSSGEGVCGLALAFRHAGAHSVCAARWPVADRATTELMRRFYSNLARHDSAPAAALAVAQRAMIAEGYHPFYWSGFGIYG